MGRNGVPGNISDGNVEPLHSLDAVPADIEEIAVGEDC